MDNISVDSESSTSVGLSNSPTTKRPLTEASSRDPRLKIARHDQQGQSSSQQCNNRVTKTNTYQVETSNRFQVLEEMSTDSLTQTENTQKKYKKNHLQSTLVMYQITRIWFTR